MRPVLLLAFCLAAALAFVMAVLPHPPELPGSPSDKVNHILAFLTLGGIGAAAFAKHPLWQLVLGLTAYGAAIELIQAIPALHRDSDAVDLLADAIAALIAALIVRKLLIHFGQQ